MAWEPVFQSFAKIMGPQIFALQYPDWRKSQGEAVENVCRDTGKFDTYVAEVDGKAVGFIAIEMNHETKFGEVYMLAVHPAYHNQGIGTELNRYALQKMREAGMKLAVVGTGGEEGHAPARASYEKAGYTGLPLMRYYQEL
jgi:ribosomal protein S18 acetylase RimI-like enzyme